MRHGDQERWGIGGESLSEPVHQGRGEPMRLDGAPGAEQQPASGRQDPSYLTESGGLVRKEHDPELTNDQVEPLVVEGQAERVSLPPCRERHTT
jgi:hypothetical protein